jgi:hypothetical protein
MVENEIKLFDCMIENEIRLRDCTLVNNIKLYDCLIESEEIQGVGLWML